MQTLGFFWTELQVAQQYLAGWGRLAQMALAQKKYDESLALLENVFSRDGANFEAGMLKVEVWLAKGEIKLQQHKRTQLDRLYQKIVDDLDELLYAVGLKAA